MQHPEHKHAVPHITLTIAVAVCIATNCLKHRWCHQTSWSRICQLLLRAAGQRITVAGAACVLHRRWVGQQSELQRGSAAHDVRRFVAAYLAELFLGTEHGLDIEAPQRPWRQQQQQQWRWW